MIKRIFQILKSSMNNNYDIPNLGVQAFLTEFQNTENAVLIDARTAAEMAEGQIEGAININFLGSDFKSQIAKLDKDKAYFVYCRSGKRSMNSCIEMQQIGIMKTTNLDGGFIAYQKQNS